ncbi:MAG: family 16 glycosylhydrolase [Chthoniobacteraceae bacterium]
MKNSRIIYIVVCALALFAFAPFTSLRAVPPAGTSYSLTFSDDFRAGTLDRTKWGPHGGVVINHESEAYVPDEVLLTGSGLRLRVDQRTYTSGTISQPYTSGEISTMHSFFQTYGYFECRARIPKGVGMWPAFWMCAMDGAWPPEIDIMENFGNATLMSVGMFYTSASGKSTGTGALYTPSPYVDYSADYHVYGCSWLPGQLTFYIDDQQVYQITDSVNVPSKPMFLILNVAMGSANNGTGAPTKFTVFPNYMDVDYVKAYQYTDLVATAPGADRAWFGPTVLSAHTGVTPGQTLTLTSSLNADSNGNSIPSGNLHFAIRDLFLGTTVYLDSYIAIPAVAAYGCLPLTASFTVPSDLAPGLYNISLKFYNSTMAYNGANAGTADVFEIPGSLPAKPAPLSTLPASPTGMDLSTLTFSAVPGRTSPAGTLVFSNSGQAMTAGNNAWRVANFNYTVTANTVMEFDFSTDPVPVGKAASSYCIGLLPSAAYDITTLNTYLFQLAGGNPLGITSAAAVFNKYSLQLGGTFHYVIPVGQYYTGAMTKLLYVMNDTANYPVNSTISHFRIYDSTSTPTASVQWAVYPDPHCLPQLATVAVSPTTAAVSTGGTQQFTANGVDADGDVYTPTVTWSVSGGGAISSNGLFTSGTTAGGPYTVTAASGTCSASASVVVNGGASSSVLTSIVLSPNNQSVSQSQTYQFAALAYDQFGVALSPQPAFSWSVSGGGTISNGGLFTAGTASGTYVVSASSGGVAGQVSVSVVTPVLAAVVVNPSTSSVVVGGTRQFSATAYDQLGYPLGVQPDFLWSVTGNGIINSEGLLAAPHAVGGPYSVTASAGEVTGTASLQVVALSPVLTRISVTPLNALVTATNVQFTATALDQYSAALATQPSFTWAVSGNGSISPSGLFTKGTTYGGPYTVAATSGSLTGTAAVTVGSPYVIFDDALRSGCSFSTGAVIVASPVQSGTAALGVTGSNYLQAGIRLSGTSGVVPRGMTYLEFEVYLKSPASSVSGISVQLGSPSYRQASFTSGTASAPWTLDGTTGKVTMSADTWHHAKLDLAGAFGSYLVSGSTNIQSLFVQLSGSVETVYIDQVAFTYTPSALSSVTVQPSSATVTKGQTLQFTAVGRDQYGYDLVSQPTFSWNASGGGSIGSSSGLFTAGTTAGGPFVVTATSATYSGTTNVTVGDLPFGRWATALFGSNTATAGDLTSNNAAGVSNLMAYALDLDPFVTQPDELPCVGVASDSGNEYLTLQFVRNPAATDITYIVQGSDDLSSAASWAPVAIWNNGAWTSLGNVTESGSNVLVRDLVPAQNTSRRFLRLEVAH